MADEPLSTGNSGQFKAGNPGKQPGQLNKITRTVKEAVLTVFNELENEEGQGLKWFAVKHPRDFYNIAAKLIPTEVKATIETENVKVNLLFPEGE